MDDVEIALAERVEAEIALTFGRGSTGLFALFAAIAHEHPHSDVLIPDLCCEVVPLAAIYAGLRPVLVDVDPTTLGPSIDDVRRKIGPKTSAVVLIYLFGVPFDAGPFLELKQQHRFVLIEDIAQAVGGSFGDKRLGLTGDAVLFSFDDTKIISGTGGALAIRSADRAAESVCRIRDEIDERVVPAGIRQLQSSFRNLTHALVDLARCEPTADVSTAFAELVPRYEPVVVAPRCPTGTETVVAQLVDLDQQRDRRFDRYLRYREGLASSEWQTIEFPAGSMCWRVPVVAPTAAAALAATQRLRAGGIPASNHYFPFSRLLGAQDNPVASDVGSRLINLWVDDVLSDADVDRTIELVRAE